MASCAAAAVARRAATRIAISETGRATFQRWMDGVDAVLFDCDGVVWRGSHGIEGARETVSALRARGKRIVFVSNNSTKSRTDSVDKLRKVCGIESTTDEIVSSAFTAALLLKSKGLKPRGEDEKVKVYVVGESGLHEELRLHGFDTIGEEDGGGRRFDFAKFSVTDLDEAVQAVVQGFDGDFSYRKLAIAASYIRYRDAVYIATNTDESFPAHGVLIPGGGSMVAALRTGSGVDPEVAGKPSGLMMELICRTIGVPVERCAMVGDRLNTDIAFGNAHGARTALVMTGVTTDEDLAACMGDAARNLERPDVVLRSVADVASLLE
jgi:phosphoglycolate/pyridoxal phosphate phosphatase family enzyme